MKSFFTYSRLVFKRPGEVPDSAREAVVEKAGKVGEVIGGAYETTAAFLKRIEFLKTSKNALQSLRDGFNRKANPLEKYPSEAEKNKQLIDFVAQQLGCSSRDLRDALYSKFSPSVNEARSNKRHEIIQRLVVLQALLPEMELTFAGAATSEIRKLEDHDSTWYMAKKNTFNEILGLYIGPSDVAYYINKHLYEIKEFANSSNPMAVAKKYPGLFLTSNPDPSRRGQFEINGHNLLDIAIAYENARDYSNLLHRSPDVRKSSLAIPPPVRFDLYVFDIPQDRQHGVTMKYRKIGDDQVGSSGISDEPASRRAEAAAGSPGAASERAPDGKEGERVDPVGDLDTFARAHKWKGLQVDPEIHGKRFDPTDISKYVPGLERVLLDIATKPQYKEFWPLLSEVKITITPRDLRDIFNPYSEGFSWDDETFKITYTKSEETNRTKILAYLREYMLYKKIGVPERPDIKKSREDLAKQTELYVKNWDTLFPTYKNDASKNVWKTDLENARDPQKFAKLLEADPLYAEKRMSAIRESVRKAYHTHLYNYTMAWDTKIGVGKKDGGGFTKEQWVGSNNSVAADKPEASSARDITFVVPWVRYFKANLEGTPVLPPVTPSGSGEKKPVEKPEEKQDSVDKLKSNTIAALAKLSTDTGVKVSLMSQYSDNADAKDDEYEYDDILAKIPGLAATLNRLTPAEKLEVNSIGVLLTPERNLIRLGVPRALYSHGLVEQSDGSQKIQIDVKEDTLKDIREAIQKNNEYKPDDFLNAMKKSYRDNYSLNLNFEGDDSDRSGIVKEWKNFEKASNEMFRNFNDAKNENTILGFFTKKKNDGTPITLNIFYGGGIVGNAKGTFTREGYIGNNEMRIDASKDSGTILSDIKKAIEKQKSKDKGWLEWLQDGGRGVYDWVTN